jgi:hypothetical protein
MAVDANYQKPQFQDPLRSKPVRETIAEIQSDVNDLQHQQDIASTPASGSETVNARDYHTVLRDRLRSASKGQSNILITGGTVLEQATPNMTVKIKAFEAIVNGVAVTKGFGTWTRSTATITMTELSHGLSNGSKIYVDVTSSAAALALGEYTVSNVTTNTFDVTGADAGDSSGSAEYSRYSGTITAPSVNPRIDVVVINSDNSVSVVAGSELANPILPSIAVSQRPVKLIPLTTSTTSITNSIMIDATNQGCVYKLNGAWQWKWYIQDAIDALSDGGDIFIGRGTYYEDLTYDDNQILTFESSAVLEDTSGSVTDLETEDLSAKTNTIIKWDGGTNPNDQYVITDYKPSASAIVKKTIKTKVMEIGNWDMDQSSDGVDSVDVTHGLTLSDIISIKGIIRNDADSLRIPLGGNYQHAIYDGTYNFSEDAGPKITDVNATIIRIEIGDAVTVSGSIFNSTSWDSTSYNRGWLVIEYISGL